ncbi:ABC transporter ATP-binding protein [Bradyrhizobium sp. WSM3983]|uniref:ABC transporter ATP-binding protein n=1 Tax=Bradyrhizobium sp. WSM3983 TaxID=1038867 RepID=UPI0005668E51|nr:ABC transporter ATP-binding protein [Bradyrhizobium sp. WSM3983]
MLGQIAIAALSVHSVAKSLGGARVVKDVSLAIKPGEFISLLGPSGCGKTTLLRMIAGLEMPDSGTIALGDKDITTVPVWERNIGVVFQNYALFPHMTVAENIAFGLRTRKVSKTAIEAKVRDALKLVRLNDFGPRSTDKLSGGQKQRVALARALVTDPKLLLLDEPLGALDRKLREQMQVELKMLQREIGITTLMVTHDQEEALTLSDRIAVMSDGKILQDDSPKEIYERPRDAFVADFIGMSNLMKGRVAELDGKKRLAVSEKVILDLPSEVNSATDVSIFVRPEKLSLAEVPGAAGSSLPGRIVHVSYSGSVTHCFVDVGLQEPLTVLITNKSNHEDAGHRIGEPIWVHWDARNIVVL